MNGGSYDSNNAIYFYKLNCTGSESTIWDCPYAPVTSQRCNYDAAIICQCKLGIKYRLCIL